MALIFIDGNNYRAGELAQIVPALEIKVEALQAGFTSAAPEPGQRARDKVAAHYVTEGSCFAEAVDLTTLDGKSLRLELDSENPNRFCKWWREKPVKMELVIALRRSPQAEIELFTATQLGVIADQPAGPLLLGWDRLFVPDGEVDTIAELSEAGEVVPFRRTAYAAMGAALGLS